MKDNIIVTFYNELNYGAVLQCYALQKFMNSFSNTKVMDLNIDLNKTNFINKIIQLPKQINFKRFKKKYIFSTNSINNYAKFNKCLQKFDNVVVGSDQVWAYDLIKKYENIFFLDTSAEINKYSYAASFGKNDNFLNNKLKTLKYLESFKGISLREKSSYDLLKKEGIDCINNIDPTLLLSSEDYVNTFNLKLTSEKYILVYMLVIDDKIIEAVNKVNEILGLKIICFNNKNRFGKKGVCLSHVSPKKFVELFYNASFIVTNSFHGTCFSIIFKKKFISVIHKTKGIRQLDLLDTAGLLDRVYDSNADINYYVNNELNISSEFYKFIDKSKQYLLNIGDSNE